MDFFKAIKLTKRFSGLTALDGISIEVNESEIVGIIGPNGSGKTTFFNCVMGNLQADEGEMLYRGSNIVGMKPHQICRLGISKTFQITELFSDFSVLENMLVAQDHRNEGILTCLFRNYDKSAVEKARYYLELLGLGDFQRTSAKDLTYGDQRLLEISMALMGDAKLILLDEPTAGINPASIDKVIKHILEASRAGITFIVIEHNMKIIYHISEKIYVLSGGQIIAEGSPEDIRKDMLVREIYT